MKVTTQQKALGGLLLIAAIGLGADRLFFSSKATVEEATAVETYAVDAPTTAATTIAASTVMTIGQKLAAMATAELAGQPERDAFLVLATPKPAQATVKPPSTFATDHRLTAVVVASGNRGQALVDGKFVSIGQTVGGMRLTAVAHDSATFSDGVESIRLRMAVPTSAVAIAQ